jgi:hypothetical protein
MAIRYIIHHASLGAFVGLLPHPRTGKQTPRFRRDEPSRAAHIFPSAESAIALAEQHKMVPEIHAIIPIRV